MPRKLGPKHAFTLAALGGAALLVACSSLFGDPVQCANDGDCAKFPGAICDIAQAVCVSKSGQDDGGSGVDAFQMDVSLPYVDAPITLPDVSSIGDGPAPPDGEAGTDAAIDPCQATNKPQVSINGTAGTPLTDGGVATVEITTNLTLTCDKDWILKGPVVVRSGATLTIDKGTTVKGDVSTKGGLYVMPGAKLVATGTANDPVVFSSSQAAGSRLPGDWAGLTILGAAGPAGKLNGNSALAYGGGAASDSSGTLSYVRVEYSNAALEIAGAGSATTIDFVQVRRTLADCFRFSGGTANLKHVACQAPASQAFELTSGYVGKAQFLLAQGAPPTADHEGLLIDGSYVTAFNATLCGTSATYNYGILPRNGAQMHLANFSITGYSAGFVIYAPMGTPFDLNSSITFGNSENPAYKPDTNVTQTSSPYFDHGNGFDVLAWFGDPTHKNSTTTDPGLASCLGNPPIFAPGTAITAVAEVQPVDGFFDAAKYVGAIKDTTDSWATGLWVDWGPQ